MDISETGRVRADVARTGIANGSPRADQIPLDPVPQRRARAAALAAVLLAGALFVSACGTSATQPQATGAKVGHRTPVTSTSPAERARFVGHAGVAFGAFHRYVYVPFRSGSLVNPAHQRVAAVKAGAAIAAATREIMLAKQAAVGSTALRKLYGPLTSLEPTLRTLATNLQRGHVNPAAIRSANGEIAGVEQIGSAAGVRIFERAPALKR